MYKIYCDTFPLLDTRDDALIVENPKAKLAVNTVGEASFTIYSDHPYYSKLKKLRSCIEISDEYDVIFRGRITNDSRDFNNKKDVDIEGAMAFFNDSIVRPFNFPEDFLDDSAYTAAAKSGNVVAFFLNWLITQHNSQVQDFQRFKLGNVSVSDPNNYLSRSNKEYKKTWDILKEKLFDSALGGFLCIRYEADGNYIDYLSEFTEENSQGIEFGKNLLDIKHDSDANEMYTAILPLGAEKDSVRLTLSGYPDGDITPDLVKKGDTLYSKNAVAENGWIYAPISETTWDDITTVENLLKKSKEFLTNTAVMFSDTVEISAADLHFEDSEIRSFRIYKNVAVSSAPHNLSATYQLTELDLDLMNPQNTKITVGKTSKTLTDVQNQQSVVLQQINAEYQEVKKNYVKNEVLTSEIEKTQSLISQREEEILLKVSRECVTTTNFNTYKAETAAEIGLKVGRNEYNQIVSMINMSSNWINIAGSRLTISSDYFALDADGTIIAQAGEIGGCEIVDGVLKIKNANIAEKLTADQINADGIKATNVELAGKITATSGSVGGWNILRNMLFNTDKNNSGYGVGLNSNPDYFTEGNRSHNIFAIGLLGMDADGKYLKNFNSWNNAAFRILADGTLIATQAIIEGRLSVTSGALGAWNVGTIPNPSNDFWGNATYTNALYTISASEDGNPITDEATLEKQTSDCYLAFLRPPIQNNSHIMSVRRKPYNSGTKSFDSAETLLSIAKNGRLFSANADVTSVAVSGGVELKAALNGGKLRLYRGNNYVYLSAPTVDGTSLRVETSAGAYNLYFDTATNTVKFS